MDKIERRLRRKKGIRKRIHGTSDKPRISVFKSNRHIYAQVIDDDRGVTVCSASDFDEGIRGVKDGAAALGELLAKRIKDHKIKEIVFDRNGFPYHGIVKAICEGVRKGGVKV
jgi:large subunit ribosomal protein L18